ncbi:MAG: hypothetical protein NUV91_01285, partial [Candidatus Omnitrophica bacterium]|nr:hypothetical protein [Candidatus Omnitrophota bacterium]
FHARMRTRMLEFRFVHNIFSTSTHHAHPKDEIPLQVIHLSGERDELTLKKYYAQNGIQACVFSFLHEMEKAYALADLVISRAGAMALTEIASWGLPVVLIPYPHAGGHQNANAEFFAAHHPTYVIREENLSPKSFKKAIETLLKEKRGDSLSFASEKIFNPQAAQQMVREIECLK